MRQRKRESGAQREERGEEEESLDWPQLEVTANQLSLGAIVKAISALQGLK